MTRMYNDAAWPRKKSSRQSEKAKPSPPTCDSAHKKRIALIGLDGAIYQDPATGDRWMISTSTATMACVLSLVDHLGIPLRPSKTISLHAMDESMAAAILADNETHIQHSKLATADWVLDQILSKEAQGINCTVDRQAAKKYFHRPEFTPLPAASFPALALLRVTDSGSDLAQGIEMSPLQGPARAPNFNAKAPDGGRVPIEVPALKKEGRNPPLSGEPSYWEEIPF